MTRLNNECAMAIALAATQAAGDDLPRDKQRAFYESVRQAALTCLLSRDDRIEREALRLG